MVFQYLFENLIKKERKWEGREKRSEEKRKEKKEKKRETKYWHILVQYVQAQNGTVVVVALKFMLNVAQQCPLGQNRG